jgi:hypothetical protein
VAAAPGPTFRCAPAAAERARTELLATGETARKRTVETHDALTAQAALIARLAREGWVHPEFCLTAWFVGFRLLWLSIEASIEMAERLAPSGGACRGVVEAA